MDDKLQQSTGAEEFLQATISVEHLTEPDTEAAVCAALKDLPGVKSVDFVEGKVQVCYNPLRITEHEIEKALQRSGQHTKSGEVERTSPFAETD